MGIAPPYTAGVRAESEPAPVVFMANRDVKYATKTRNPVGTVCALPSDTFHPEPHLSSRIEVVSVEPVSVIGVWAVRYSTLSFDLDALPPLTIPGVSDGELATLVASGAPRRLEVN